PLGTAVPLETLQKITASLTTVPGGFEAHAKIRRLLEGRARELRDRKPIDWGFAELLAFGSLLLEGTHVRLSGQDSGRGTFSQRHAVLFDTRTGKAWSPLSELRAEDNPSGRFEVFDSSLSEAGVLGFEYGYSVVAAGALVMWEAQFGDFNYVAQSIIDQYITASEDKWK